MILLILLIIKQNPAQFFTGLPKQKQLIKQEFISSVSTDRAAYKPGAKVIFSLNSNLKGKATIDYFHLGKKIEKKTLTVASKHVTWTWIPPKSDFQGYMVHIKVSSKSSYDEKSIGVDVSSTWSRFPRYGFLSDFKDMPKQDIEKIISKLNRYHLNGLQFYDWQYQHQQPLKMNGSQLASHWEDIANRTISTETIKKYIAASHQRGMNAMAYNLLYGSFEGEEGNGISPDWYLYKGQGRNGIDKYPLPENWKSNLIIMNTTHPTWREYLINKQKQVYQYLPFDGWHIDQLGDRGDVFNERGDKIDLSHSFQPFINEIKDKIPQKSIVMNAVNQYGQEDIANSPVDFMYTEVWDKYKNYGDLKGVIDHNTFLSHHKNSVLAAYMDYERSNQPGYFNEAGILLADSTIFASGGSHLEMGEHMLSKEYFPHSQLKVSKTLEEKMISYYDFLTAYENLLRDHLSDSSVSIRSGEGLSIVPSPAVGTVWSIAKQKENKYKIVHLVNFSDSLTMEWRDTYGSTPTPTAKQNINIMLDEVRPIKSMWIATPDDGLGLPQKINFIQKKEEVFFRIPSLKYWDMVVMEF